MITGLNQLLENLYNQTFLYFLCLIICIYIYWHFLKKFFIDLFDPAIYMLVGSIFASTAVLFMAIKNIVNPFDGKILLYFFTEFSFILGIIIYPKKKMSRIKRVAFIYEYNAKYDVCLDIVFYFLFLILLLFEVILFVKVGQSSSFSNHVAFTANTGILGELSDGLITVVLFLCWYRFYKKKYIDTSVVLACITFFLLSSGAKSALLKLGFTLFYFKLFVMLKEHKKLSFWKCYIILIIVAILGLIFTVARNENTFDLYSIFQSIILRFLAFGDTFAFIYANNNYILEQILSNNNIVTTLIEPIGRLLFIVDHSGAGQAIGNQIMSIATGNLIESGGVNVRHNLYNLICFGPFFSCAASFVLGRLVVYITRDVFYSKRMNLFKFMYFILWYEAVLSAVTDPGLFVIALFRRLPGMFMLLTFVRIFVLRISNNFCRVKLYNAQKECK